MTNADKYNISEVQADKMSDEFAEWHQNNSDVRGYGEALYRFFQAKVKPTLTEDEKVILKNIKDDYITIAKDKAGELFIATERDEYSIRGHNALEFKHDLFQFIQPRRRI